MGGPNPRHLHQGGTSLFPPRGGGGGGAPPEGAGPGQEEGSGPGPGPTGQPVQLFYLLIYFYLFISGGRLRTCVGFLSTRGHLVDRVGTAGEGGGAGA